MAQCPGFFQKEDCHSRLWCVVWRSRAWLWRQAPGGPRVVAKVAAMLEPQMWHAATWNELRTMDDDKWHGSSCSSQAERGAGTICRDGPSAAGAEMLHHGPERIYRPYSAPANMLPLALLPAGSGANTVLAVPTFFPCHGCVLICNDFSLQHAEDQRKDAVPLAELGIVNGGSTAVCW